ncbi:MAG: NusG domain II-containing protein [Clostridia bacterium]|nr:NusG domain II-containing protein [Clostridia bacterium]
MPKRKDLLLIVLVLALAAAMLGVSKLMPKTDLSEKVAQATLAPDAIEYVEATPSAAPAVTQIPQQVVMYAEIEETEALSAQPAVTQPPQQVVVTAETAEPTEAPTAEPTEEPKKEAAMIGPMPPKKAEVVRGHVVLTVGGRQYGDPIPMDRDKIITLRQDDGKINKVHITPEKVYMESSTCDNQDCVQQGEVHVDTYQDRILGTYVICLPNNVSIEMVPAE